MLLPPPMEFQEQIAHLRRPHLALLFPQELQFPQQVLVAQGVLALLIRKIRLPVIMHHPLEAVFFESAMPARPVQRAPVAGTEVPVGRARPSVGAANERFALGTPSAAAEAWGVQRAPI